MYLDQKTCDLKLVKTNLLCPNNSNIQIHVMITLLDLFNSMMVHYEFDKGFETVMYSVV